MSLSSYTDLIVRLRALIAGPHDECDDPWYSCPKSHTYKGHDDREHCTCGKDARDLLLGEVIAALTLASVTATDTHSRLASPSVPHAHPD
jgi:hypothetical protein